MGNNPYYFPPREAKSTVVVATHVCADIPEEVNGLMSLPLKVTFLP